MPAARYYSGNHKPIDEEKHDDGGLPAREVSGGSEQGTAIVESAPLRRALHGRHMQMIAIGTHALPRR